MARKGTTVWEVSRESLETSPIGQGENYIAVETFALREDGVLLSKYATRNVDGSARHDYGWKVRTRKPKANVREILQGKGYK